MTKNQLNVALFGYGYAGKTFHTPLITCTPTLKLSMVVSSNQKKVQHDHPEMTEITVSPHADHAFANDNIDLVVIATPNDTHFDLASRALDAGKHVVVDKPFTTTVNEARQLIALAEKKKLLLSVFHNRRWDGDFLTLKQLFDEGTLGEVVHFESHFDRFRPVVQRRWREEPGAGGGLWFDLGPHLLDQALQLFGDPDAVFGDLAIQRDGATAIDFFHVTLRYGKMRAILHASALVAAESARFTVHGTESSFIKYGLDVQEDALKRGELPGRKGWGVDSQKSTITTVVDGVPEAQPYSLIPGCYPEYYQRVADAILHGKPNPVPPEQALKVMELLELAEASCTSRKELAYAPLHNSMVEQV